MLSDGRDNQVKPTEFRVNAISAADRTEVTSWTIDTARFVAGRCSSFLVSSRSEPASCALAKRVDTKPEMTETTNRLLTLN